MDEEENSCFICFEACNVSTQCVCKLYVCDACLLKSMENKPNICTVCKTPYKNIKTKFQMYKSMKSSNVRLCIVNIIAIILAASASILLLLAFFTHYHMVLVTCGIFFAIYTIVIICIIYHVRRTVCIFPDLFDHSIITV